VKIEEKPQGRPRNKQMRKETYHEDVEKEEERKKREEEKKAEETQKRQQSPVPNK